MTLDEYQEKAIPKSPPRMRITLCGSTKFKDEYLSYNLRLSKAGHVVYSVAGFGHNGDALTPEEKQTLDAVHLCKIDNSDAIYVVAPGGYVGDSTKREIVYAHKTGKRIFCAYPLAVSVKPGVVIRAERTCPYAGCSDPLCFCPCALCYE
jgi:hypothetical protein